MKVTIHSEKTYVPSKGKNVSFETPLIEIKPTRNGLNFVSSGTFYASSGSRGSNYEQTMDRSLDMQLDKQDVQNIVDAAIKAGLISFAELPSLLAAEKSLDLAAKTLGKAKKNLAKAIAASGPLKAIKAAK